MKIFSKFRDYYDGYADYSNDDDKAKYYIREEKEIEISKYLLQNLEDEILRTPQDFGSHYLIIAGRVHPFVSVYTNPGWDYVDNKQIYIESRTDYYFDHVSLMNKYNEVRDRTNRERKKGKYPWWRWHSGFIERRDVSSFFTKDYPDMTNLCIDHNTPVILISPEWPGYKNKDKTFRTCTKDVNLKEYGLSKVFTAPEIYQILDVFVSNVLVKDEMPMSPMSNEEKIQSHGFDKKTSFRHPVK